MPKQGDVHVMPAEKGWKVEVEGQTRANGLHDTQEAAWEQAQRVAKENKSEALLHGRDGQIRERSTYGLDPTRTKG